MKIRAIAALAALLVQAAAAFSPAALPRVSLQRHASMASHTARPPLRRSAGRGGARIAMAAGGAPGGKKEEEAFEVTWEHEDGTTDTTTAEKLKDLKEKPQGVEAPGPLGKVKNFFKGLVGGAKMDKASLAKIGTSALLSYGFVSNLSHISCLIASWVIHGRKTGLSPLDAVHPKSLIGTSPTQWTTDLSSKVNFPCGYLT
ncbi:hypothetical protein T484DRAFT_1983036 [Baffinella frigidus]|nr:hypothetical protein T484DRAFT_1983036 [Cryptophyta sp. CCMP2293]